MKRILLSLLFLFSGYAGISQTAGTAAALSDTICSGSSTFLTLTGFNGFIQWQSNSGSGWVNETDTGSTSDFYEVSPLVNTDYQAIVTDSLGNAVTSNIITLVSLTVADPIATGASRCGYGSITLSASGSGDMQWFDAASGGNLIGQGNTFTTTVSQTETFYVSANINGGSGGESPILLMEMDVYASADYLELQNVSPAPVDVTGWKVAVSNSYTDVNLVNTIVQTLSGTLNPGDIISFSDGSGNPNYWGNNILWNPGSNGWVILLDNNNVIRDIIVADWTVAEMASFAPTIAGTQVFPNTIWSGDGVITTGTTLSIVRNGYQDNNNASDFTLSTQTPNTTNPNVTLPFTGFGCSSNRVPAIATVTPAPSINVTANPPSLCAGDSSTLSVSSSNASYAYAWSPVTAWLSDSTGSSVTAYPPVDVTYVVIADDGTCGNIDSLTMDVGIPTAGGTAATLSDTICTGASATLTLTGSVGTIQWQSNTGSGWINEGGNGSDSTSYQVTPSQLTEYRAVITSGGCPADTSTSFFIATVSVGNPVVQDTSRCGPGVVNLSATGNGDLFWFTSQAGGAPVANGGSYAPYIFATLTYYVENRVGPPLLHVGPAQNNIGTVGSLDPNNTGIRFDVLQNCTLENVYVYPDSAGTVVINLRQTQGGPILATASRTVVPGGKTVIPLNFSLTPGTLYRLEVDPSSPDLRRNTSGVTFPYTSNLVNLTASLAPGVSTTTYYFLYDWEVSAGCKSSRVAVTGTIIPLPPTPLITVNGTQLSSSISNGNQWYQDGTLIPGATNQTYTVTANGNYFVSVTQNGCTSYSDTIFASSVSEWPEIFNHFHVSPNPGNGMIQVDAGIKGSAKVSIEVCDALGRVILSKEIGNNQSGIRIPIDLSHLQTGVYLVSLMADGNKATRRIVINE